jgi:phosphoglycolate phosphatase-like HAD superfamily hydrolase
MAEKKLIIFDFYGVMTGMDLKDLIARLSENYTLAICSSTGSGYLRAALEEDCIAKYFSAILGIDVDRSKAVKLRSLIETYGAEAVFVTDTLGDMRESAVAGVACIGVTWGMQDREALEKGGPYAIVDTVPELEDAIGKFFVIQ